MKTLLYKPEVNFGNVQPIMFFALGVAYSVYAKRNFDFVVTSLNDSHEKRPKSLHNAGLGADLRTRHIPAVLLPEMLQELKELLDPLGFDVVLEGNHFHIEYDPKPGETWKRQTV